MPPRRSMTLGVGYEARIVSAHRTPDRLVRLRQGRRRRGLQGDHRRRRRRRASARHDGGDDARCRCSACRSRSKALSGAGQSAVRSCRCRPASRSARSAIGEAGAVNAALLAAAVLALADPALAERLDAWRASADRRAVAERPERRGVSADADRCSPGATIGILGGGQLGRMLAHRRARGSGFRATSSRPRPDAPAFDVAQPRDRRRLRRHAALDRFAARRRCRHLRVRERAGRDASTFLAARVPVLPDAAGARRRPRTG